MAKQEITDREEGGKQEKLPLEGYDRLPTYTNAKKEWDQEANIAIGKMIAFFYSRWLDYATYKCKEYNINKEPKELLDEALEEVKLYTASDELRMKVNEYRNIVVFFLNSKSLRLAHTSMTQEKELLFTEIRNTGNAHRSLMGPKITTEELYDIIPFVKDIDLFKYLISITLVEKIDQEGGQS